MKGKRRVTHFAIAPAAVEITGILTTHNRAQLLPAVLQGLQQQTLDRARFEILVIDDGSTDETPRILHGWSHRLPLRMLRQNAAGLAAAKNLGVLAARAPLVVFLDDDDVPAPGLLAAHLAAHLEQPDPAAAMLGHTIVDPRFASHPVMRHVTEVGCQFLSYGWMKPGQVLGYTEFWGGRSSCKRGFLIRHGLFNPEFDFGCEDIELGWRLSRHGLRVIYQPHAVSTMIRGMTFDQFCDRSYRQGRSQRRFADLHDDPAIRAYCEIDRALEAWSRRSGDYAGHLRWVRKLEALVLARAAAALPPHGLLGETLDRAYREAFFLSRAKGIADAGRTASVHRDRVEPVALFEYGLA
jgi:glycosyltransferase involved in cell wall biosynthesis